MKINNKVSNGSLFEIGHGAKEARFAFVNPKTGDTITPFCKCKDYFTDMFWSNNMKKNANVCGFKWEPNEDKGILDEKILMVAIGQCNKGTKVPDVDATKEQAENISNFLKKFNKGLKFTPSTVELSDDKKYIIVTFDRRWSERPYLISGFFLLLRLGLNYNNYKIDPISFYKKANSKDFYSPHDQNYFGTVANKLSDLLEGKIDTKQTYAMYTSASYAHDAAGIVGYKNYKI